MVYAIVFINSMTVCSILLINIITIFVMNLLGTKHPLLPIKENYIAIFNEFIIIVMMNLMLITSLPTIEVERKKGLGWMMVYILSISIAISQGMLLISSLCEVKRKCKLKALRKKNKKLYDERQQKHI